MAPVTGSLILLMLCCAGALEDYYDEPTPSPPEKPGKCSLDPLINCALTIIAEKCKSDYDCYGKQKCCRTLCTRLCIHPIKETPGTCPPVPLTVCSSEMPPGICEVDSDCPGKQKCCVICSSQCMDVE
ncbi:omwaprin-c-like [Bufo gargarizans]|uniref:omwaprin-c-like n=1 Tax=Bufo gargarizans TaxID=30331 RepID=UPI001CF1C3D2|nr:omwaprin-c-like [Bufo gargarizans]